MKFVRFFVGTAVAIHCMLSIVHAQPLYWLGAHAGYNMNLQRGSIDIVPGSSLCGTYTNGSGSGFNGGFLFELPVADQFRISARAGYTGLGGTIITQLDNGIQVYSAATKSTVPLMRQHTYAATLNYLTLDLPIRYAPFDFPLGFLLGPSLALPVFGATYENSEQIVSPAGYLYPNNSLTQIDGSGNLANTRLRIAALAGVGYDLPIGPISALSPEVMVSFPFTNVVSGESWKAISFSAGLALKIGIEPSITPPHPPVMLEPGAPPPIAPLPPAPVVDLRTSNAADIHIVETTVTETFPILPYIFFDKNSSRIPSRYVRRTSDSTATFREETLPDNAQDIYHNILDLTGKRMTDDPSSSITLIGTTDGKDAEKGNAELGTARAETVKQYLISVWNIDSSRIQVQSRDLPVNPTDTAYPEGDEENRRVEIVSRNGNIFSPIVHANFTEYSMTPPMMVFNLGAASQAGVASWLLVAQRNGEKFASFKGNGVPPKEYSWTIPNSVARSLADTDHIMCSLTVLDVNGQESTSERAVPVYKQKNSVEIGRLSLIVFDFDKSDISQQNRAMMGTFVADAVHPASTISITGSTDRLGEAAHNQELSDARAQNVKKILLASKPQANVVECKGIGESVLKYDNNAPEGRYYCRTVAINVQTPVAAQ